MARGDHVRAGRGVYSHHGIDLGDGRVVHYSGLADGLRSGPVALTSMERFAAGRPVDVVEHRRRLDPNEAVERALSRIGEDRYNLLWRNCEHFATWAVTGRSRSRQVRRAAAGVGTAVLTATVVLVRSRTGRERAA
jgi:hypothetical protein